MTPFCRWGSEGRRGQATGKWQKDTLAGSVQTLGPTSESQIVFCLAGAMAGLMGQEKRESKVT